MKNVVKSWLAQTPFRVVRRTQLNRFQAINEAIASLAARGFAPDTVVDCGAHKGGFTDAALNIFPLAVIHAIEPQPGCFDSLQSLKKRFTNRVVVHPIALCDVEADGTFLSLATDEEQQSTGAHVVRDSSGLSVPCRTLDSTLAPHAKDMTHALLKLDLQGYEMHALRGAATTLAVTDVILTEVSFYAQAYEPSISSLIGFLSDMNFELYDVASIYARPRDDRPRQGDFVFVRRDAQLAGDTAWS